MSVDERLAAMGLTLPPVATPVGAYVPAVRTGTLVFTSGQLPTRDGELLYVGAVPNDVSMEAAQASVRQAALNALAAVAAELGGLDHVTRIVRVNVFVQSSPHFTDQSSVANGASELLGELFGQAGRHTRCAIGVSNLPRNAPVELDLIVETR